MRETGSTVANRMKLIFPWSGRGLRWLVLLCGLGVAGSSARAADAGLGVALYGANGHQLTPAHFARQPHARLVAVAGVREAAWPAGVKRAATLDELLADPAVQLVTLCSPRRADQARDAIRCLEAGKHV
jgi:predicted dehydrogenase